MTRRRFLVAPSLARLVDRETGPGTDRVEGFFPPQPERRQVVRVEPDRAQLILMTAEAGEERVEVPRGHAEALLDVVPGRVALRRTTLALADGTDAILDRFVVPGALDVVTVAFAGEDEAAGFAPPAWFGPEITADARYERGAIGFDGIPEAGEPEPSNAAIDALLDALDTLRAPAVAPVVTLPDLNRVEVERGRFVAEYPERMAG